MKIYARANGAHVSLKTTLILCIWALFLLKRRSPSPQHCEAVVGRALVGMQSKCKPHTNEWGDFSTMHSTTAEYDNVCIHFSYYSIQIYLIWKKTMENSSSYYELTVA